MRTHASILSSLLHSDASTNDIVDAALALAPFGHAEGIDVDKGSAHAGKSLLRLAIERRSPWASLEQLDLLASTHTGGTQQAWALANSGPTGLAEHLAERLRGYGEGQAKLLRGHALRFLEVSSDAQLARADSHHATPLGEALLDFSDPNALGIEPYVALLARQGKSIATARLKNGSPAILRARCPEAFTAFLAAGGDPRMDVEGQPLWDALREVASRSNRDKGLAQAVEAWGKLNESQRENEREIKEYFDALGQYGGEEKLKSRKDWHQVRDQHGRSAPMAVCLGRSPAIKTFWTIKKAESTAAMLDNDGRGLWHALIAKGKDAPVATSAYLAEHCPLLPDANGRGLLPSIWAMRVGGRMPSEHEWLFEKSELGRACAFVPGAHAWLACPDPKEATSFGDWLANERYLGSRGSEFPRPGVYPTPSRSVELLSELAMKLDTATFRGIPAPILGAMAFNLAISSSQDKDQVRDRIASMLSCGAYVALSAERKAIMGRHATAIVSDMILEAFCAAEQRIELDGLVAHPKTTDMSPGKPRI